MSVAEIEAAEDALRSAMLAGDADRLDMLLDDTVSFVDPSGRRIGKTEDLAPHRSGQLRIERIDKVDRTIAVHGSTAIVVISARLAGNFEHVPIAGDYTYTRVWHRTPNGWRVIGAQATQRTG